MDFSARKRGRKNVSDVHEHIGEHGEQFRGRKENRKTAANTGSFPAHMNGALQTDTYSQGWM